MGYWKEVHSIELHREEKVEVNHPAYYGGKDNNYEAIKVIEAWDLGFCLGNVIKYLSRAGKKEPNREIEDLEKALWYLERHIKKKKEARPCGY
jgi:hypothetical protein